MKKKKSITTIGSATLTRFISRVTNMSMLGYHVQNVELDLSLEVHVSLVGAQGSYSHTADSERGT
jgi:hypothetical protein